jgi:hypothetical protein
VLSRAEEFQRDFASLDRGLDQMIARARRVDAQVYVIAQAVIPKKV